jgi:hypothetical protein
MIPFDALVQSLAGWRRANGMATGAAPMASAPADVRAPINTVISAPPDSGRVKPPLPVRDFTEVPDDAIEEDGPDYAMSFDGPAAAVPAVVPDDGLGLDAGDGADYPDVDATIAGGD